MKSCFYSYLNFDIISNRLLVIVLFCWRYKSRIWSKIVLLDNVLEIKGPRGSIGGFTLCDYSNICLSDVAFYKIDEVHFHLPDTNSFLAMDKRGIEWSLRAFASMRAECLFLRAQAFDEQLQKFCEHASTHLIFASNSSKGQILRALLKLNETIIPLTRMKDLLLRPRIIVIENERFIAVCVYLQP